MLSRRLERSGYEVVVARRRPARASRWPSRRPDLILMDMSLPVLDGWEATRRLKAAPRPHDPDHRPDRARDVRRPREGARRRLRRLRHQADRARRACSARSRPVSAPLTGDDRRQPPTHEAVGRAAPRAADAAQPDHRLRRDAGRGCRCERRVARAPSRDLDGRSRPSSSGDHAGASPHSRRSRAARTARAHARRDCASRKSASSARARERLVPTVARQGRAGWPTRPGARSCRRIGGYWSSPGALRHGFEPPHSTRRQR